MFYKERFFRKELSMYNHQNFESQQEEPTAGYLTWRQKRRIVAAGVLLIYILIIAFFMFSG
jgi:hypothetical protein